MGSRKRDLGYKMKKTMRILNLKVNMRARLAFSIHPACDEKNE